MDGDLISAPRAGMIGGTMRAFTMLLVCGLFLTFQAQAQPDPNYTLSLNSASGFPVSPCRSASFWIFQMASPGKGPATCDFLGFTLYWRRARSGRWGMWCKTRSSRLQRAIKVAADWCRRHRHEPVAVQHAALSRRIRGHFNYFGVSGNYRSLVPLVEATKRNWFKWLRRRSNRSRLTWQKFAAILQRYPLPIPRIQVRIWGA